jgi:hypothetical protein
MLLVGVAAAHAQAPNAQATSMWAYPEKASKVRDAPDPGARTVGRLHFLTEDKQAEVYMVLTTRLVASTGVTWAEVSVPGRPNGRTGWVPSGSLGKLHMARNRLVVSRTTLRAVLYNAAGRKLWSARVGVGRPSLPTPAGHFYVREKLRALGGGLYGPYAIGTSAYATKLSEWPGGGVVGLHGTDEPQLIPGRPSHGCVRMRNRDITRLWRLISVGTPIDIT